tara:strand:- start:979 stop:1776 length:798 start_codon:yes stop_codon:yes gene_type:complete
MSLVLMPIHKNVASQFVSERHYSSVMPRLTKHFLGFFQENILVGALTLGWGTNPMGTIKKMFPELTTKDYFEIGKMCMDDSMPRNSESQMLSLTHKWIRDNLSNIKFLYTWADGIVGKPGYVYQSANYLYGGFIWTDIYVTDKGEKIHFRTIQRQLKTEMGRHDLKYGPRPNDKIMGEKGYSRVWGKQFKFIYPITKKDRKYLHKYSTVDWNLNHPKDSDLEWKIKRPGETSYTLTSTMPFVLSKVAEVNKKHKYIAENNLDNFL